MSELRIEEDGDVAYITLPPGAYERYLEQCWRPILEAEALVLLWWIMDGRKRSPVPLSRARYQRTVQGLLRSRRHRS